MMKNIYIFLLLALLAVGAHSQTNVSGFINANTTWNLAGSPYIVVGNALVSYGYTLTIDPGVIVKFDTNKVLQIDGELIAIGLPNSRITFTSLQLSPHAGDWGKIHFSDICVDAILDSLGNYISGCIMKNCDVLYGGSLGFGEIHIESSSPYFNNCKIIDCSSSGIYSHLASASIDSCSIKNCTTAILYNNYNLTTQNIFIRYDTIQNNTSGGIYIGTGGGSQFFFTIANCYFTLNHSAISTSNYSHRNIIINENLFYSNSGSVITAIGLENHSISCNKFINNSGPVIYLYNYPASGFITQNISLLSR